jgi:hypothetical protein
MGLVVTGIAPTADITALEAGLTAAGLPLDPIQLVEPGAEADVVPPMGLAGADLSASLPTGTGVPGLTSHATLGSTPYVHPDAAVERLGDLEIPDDEIENYLEALGAGRTIVAYFAKPESVDQIEGIFRTSGLAKVKRF